VLVSVAGEPLPLSTARASLRLWAYLLLHRHAALPRKHVAFTLWPDATESQALAHLRRHIHLLHNLLPLAPDDRPWLLADRTSVQWNPDADDWLDVEAFEEGCAAAESEATTSERPAPAAVRRLEETVALYRGDLLVDFYDDWVLVERERLREQFGHALTRLLALQASRGDLHAAVAVAERLVEHDDLREGSHRLAIGLHHLAGDRAAALNAFRDCQCRLKEDLDVEPMAETAQLVDAIRASASTEEIIDLLRPDLPSGTDPGALRPLEVPHNLPRPVTSLIGRQSELRELEHHLCSSRLITLTGPAGCGKSRLALEFAADTAERIKHGMESCAEPTPAQRCPSFRNGLWWVELAPVETLEDVPRAVATELGVGLDSPDGLAASIEAHLRHQEALLLLDGCEHVLAACAALAERLLRTCPDLRVLATSREPLGVYGEMTWRVPPLSVPPPAADPSAERVLSFDAPRLFLDRARLVLPGARLSDNNAPAVASLCRNLDGIPLAIELAASQMQALSADQIALRLDDRFALLRQDSRTGPAHHQTLEAAIDWSFDSLTERQRRMFRRLSVFHNDWTLEAATGVCVGDGIAEGDILELVSTLVDKSLVVVTGTRVGRARTFRMLESVRQYARVKLAGTEDAKTTKAQHLSYYAAQATEAGQNLLGAEQARWIERVDRDLDNYRAALEFGLTPEGDSTSALGMAASLQWYWVVRGFLDTGRNWLRRGLAAYTKADVTRQRGLQCAAILADLHGDYGETERLARENLEIATANDDPTGQAASYNLLGNLCVRSGRLADAQELYEDSVETLRGVGHEEGVASALHNLGMVHALRCDFEAARERVTESLVISRDLADTKNVAISLHQLGTMARAVGDLDRAKEHLLDSLDLCVEIEHSILRPAVLGELGSVALAARDFEAARSRFEESLALCERMDDQEGVASMLESLGHLGLAEGNAPLARSLHRRALTLRQGLQDARYLPSSLEALAEVDLVQDRADRSAQLFGAAETIRESVNMPLPPMARADHDRLLGEARSKLGEQRFDRAWRSGARMSMGQAIDRALGLRPVERE